MRGVAEEYAKPLFFVALGALGGTLAHLGMAPLAGLVRPVLAEIGYLAAFVGFMALGASHFFHFLVLLVRESDVAVFGGERYHGAAGCEGETCAEKREGDCYDDTIHCHSPLSLG
jgi:hypothetical protein